MHVSEYEGLMKNVGLKCDGIWTLALLKISKMSHFQNQLVDFSFKIIPSAEESGGYPDGSAVHIKRTAPSFCASASQVSHTPHDNVLQSTMMWLLLTISSLMFIAAKSEENPEVSMSVVSPFLTCLVVQVTCAVMVCARRTGSVCLH